MNDRKSQMDFMTAQAHAMRLNDQLRGEQTGVVAMALAMMVADFCLTCGADPHDTLVVVANRALEHLNQVTVKTDEPPVSVN